MAEPDAIEGSCLCGAVRWRFAGVPESALACNCTACRRFGVLWAYDFEDERVQVSGATRAYARGERVLEFRFCPVCGCLACWRATRPNAEGRRRIAVNLRLADPDAVARIPVERFDGAAWTDLPDDGRRVADHWF